MIEYCNHRFPGKSTTECYEFIKALIFLICLIMANVNEVEAIGKYASPARVLKKFRLRILVCGAGRNVFLEFEIHTH